MRLVTSRRLRAVGILLLEAAGLVLLIADRVGGDRDVRRALGAVIDRVRSL